MRNRDLLLMSLRNTFRGQRTTMLSAAAIAVAITSLILISAVGNGTVQLAGEELDRLGVDGLSLYLDETEDRALDPDCAVLLEKNVPGVRSSMPYKLKIGTAQLMTTCENAVIWGVGSGMLETMGLKLLHGREIRKTDVDSCAHTAVIDVRFAKSVYQRENIVGKTIRIRVGERWDDYEIIGIMASQTESISSIVGADIGSFIYIPYTTVNENTGEYGVDQIAVQCGDSPEAEQIGERALKYLSRVVPVPEGQYRMENITGYLDQVKEIVQLIRILITSVSGISLLVAGFGVMNGMLAGMPERRRELGICLAVGAVRRDIIWSVILESLIVCLTGCFLGILAGAGGTLLISRYVPCSLKTGDIVGTTGLSLFCGLLFGTLPAIQASHLDPIEILNRN